jgi:hypothetical protein
VLILNHVPTPCCHDDPSLDRKDKPGNDGGKTPKRSIDEKEVCFLHPFNVANSARALFLVAAAALAVATDRVSTSCSMLPVRGTVATLCSFDILWLACCALLHG